MSDFPQERHLGSDFPNCAAYPLEACVPPKDILALSGRGSSGALTRHPDGRETEVRLETIWQPIWDLEPIYSDVARRLSFFQTSCQGRRYYPYFLKPEFPWPKRYHIWEISFDAPTPSSDMLERAMVWCHVGEKNCLTVPFLTLLHRPATSGRIRRFIPLCTPLFIPPIQNYSIFLEWGQTEVEVPPAVTCVVGGYLHREIC